MLMFILTSAPVICQWILGSSYRFELKGPKWGRISKFFQTFIFFLILTNFFLYINDRFDECSITDQAITIFNFPMSTYCGCIMLFWRTPSVKHETWTNFIVFAESEEDQRAPLEIGAACKPLPLDLKNNNSDGKFNVNQSWPKSTLTVTEYLCHIWSYECSLGVL